MQKKEIVEFLEKFNIKKEKIEQFLDKKIVVINNNGDIFLTKNQFKKNQVYAENILFISLQKLTPSRYLLENIKENTTNTISISTQKQIQRILYGEDLSIDAVDKKQNFIKGQYYLIINNNKPIGIVEYLEKGKFPFKNIYNLGDYLHE